MTHVIAEKQTTAIEEKNEERRERILAVLARAALRAAAATLHRLGRASASATAARA